MQQTTENRDGIGYSKVERLHAGTHQTVSQSTCTETVEHVVGAASVNPLGPFGQDSKPMITSVECRLCGTTSNNNTIIPVRNTWHSYNSHLYTVNTTKSSTVNAT